MAPRPGRRPGKPDTRAHILEAAARLFADSGYDRATVRAIAAAADVDPALISHYFGSKEQLFIECVRSPIDPRDVVEELKQGPAETMGQRLLEIFLRVWDSPMGRGIVGLLRTAMQHDWSARLVTEFLVHRALGPMAAHTGRDPQESEWRVSLVASQIAGLIMARYILRLEPLASASHADVIAAIAPTLQRYLTGELPPR